ncbi:wolframin-like [Littorina saxatilis]|uniref:Wolframin n=1 Tax=Littorina saxatilis TaxID=31220 RepID=A0AAN9GK52_9CAEN
MADSSKNTVTEETVATWLQEADNGSEADQARLGSHFLSLADSGVDRDTNAANAIRWLIQASRQGNGEATTLLVKCTKTGTGITEQNAADVNWCVNTSSSEKKIRHAARSLFHRINRTHKDVISKDEYLDAISGLTDSVRQQKLLAAAGKRIGDEINENEFVKMLSKKIQGKVTLTSDELDNASASYKSAGVVTKVFVYPRQTASVLLDQGLEWASKEGLQFVMSMVPTNQIYILAMLFAYSFLTPAFVFLIVPLFVFYLSLVTLVVATLQMFYRKKKQKDATELAVVLQKFDVNINMDDTQSQYSWNSLTPYFVFFCTLPLMVISFALANKAYVPCSELFVLAAFMTGFCFIGLSDEHDKLTFLLLLAHTIGSLPVFLQNFPAIPLVTTVVKFLTEPFLAVYFGAGVHLNFSIPSLFYMVIPFFFIRLGMKKSWSGIHRVIIPHLVCYFWYNIMTASYPYTTWTGLGRATIGYLLLPILVPLSLLFVLLLIAYVIYKLTQTQVFGKIMVTALLLSIPILLTQTKSLFGSQVDKKLGSTKKIVMIVFAVLAVLPLIFIQVPQLTESKTLTLPWEEFQDLCVPKYKDNVPSFQLRCRAFTGTRVTWQGTFAWSKITKVENTAESVFKPLPSFVASPLFCIYGESNPECDESAMTSESFKYCKLMESTGRSCHLRNHDVYTFHIGVNVADVSLVLEAGNGFYTKVMALEVDDQLEFTGSLVDGLGTRSPTLKVNAIKVLNRELPKMMSVEQEEDEEFFYRVMHDGVRETLNFFFFPIFEYAASPN